MECETGYGGVLCAVCVEQYEKFGGRCFKCQDDSGFGQYVLGIGVFGALSVGVYYMVRETLKTSERGSSSSMAAVKIMINYMMQTSLLSSFNLDWGASLRFIFR
jgi:hypothetical protein